MTSDHTPPRRQDDLAASEAAGLRFGAGEGLNPLLRPDPSTPAPSTADPLPEAASRVFDVEPVHPDDWIAPELPAFLSSQPDTAGLVDAVRRAAELSARSESAAAIQVLRDGLQQFGPSV